MPTPLVLGVLALVLAGPLPRGLAGLRGLRRTPSAAIVLWQSVALAAVLAALGAGLAVVADQVWQPQVSTGQALAAVAAGVLTAVVLGRLLLSAHRTGRNLRRLRRLHREQVDLLARSDRGMHVLDHEVPVAYCVPGMTGARIVVSERTLAVLGEAELAAVLAHERSHLRARHDLVLEAFTVLHRAFPRWVSSAQARGEVQLLVEVLADRAAVRRGGRAALLRALLVLAGSQVPRGALAAAGGGLSVRADLLRDSRPHRLQAAAVLTVAVGLLALPTALVVVPWLAALG